MQVSELIDLVAQLAFARSSTSIKERVNYQRFLNLANLELWQILINSSKFYQTVNVFLDADGTVTLPISYYLKGVFVNTKALVKSSVLSDILDLPPNQYNFLNGKLQLNTTGLQVRTDPSDNTVKKYVTLLIVPNCQKLVETVSDPAAEVDTPVFAEPYHLSLVHGALYYLFVSGNGFTEKIKYQLASWDVAKNNFQTFYGQ